MSSERVETTITTVYRTGSNEDAIDVLARVLTHK